MDVSQALKDTENTLRDFIAWIMIKKYGTAWLQECGISPEKIQKWEERRNEDVRRVGGTAHERLIYYADFYDIQQIFEKNWSKVPEFAEALGSKKELMLWLSKLEGLRNPNAHSRELLPHQKSLILGIEGEIRMKLIQYRSKQETGESYYPIVEFARDSLGTGHAPMRSGEIINTNVKLRPGDKIDFVVTARHPLGEDIMYGMKTSTFGEQQWSKDNTFTITIENFHIGARFIVTLRIRTHENYHQFQNYDYDIRFEYEVLPAIRIPTNVD